MEKRALLILIVFITFGSIFRLYNLFWGAPFYFHPDERNIAHAISQLIFGTQFNPHFFAYGSLPIYVSFFLGLASQSPMTDTLTFEKAIHILRIISSLLSILLIPLIYFCGKLLKDKITGVIAAFFATFSIGFIQYAHFGTFEMWLTFFSTLGLYFTLLFLKKPSLITYILLSTTFGILLSTKISSFVLLPLFFLPLIIYKKKLHFKKIIIGIVLLFTTTGAIFLLSNPFSYLDKTSFINSISYESSVATGSTIVFYTGEFLAANPVTFHFLHVYPFLLNPLILFLFIPSTVLVIVICIKKRSLSLLFLIAWLGLTLIPQLLLFVKWTRYLIPTLPFVYLIVALTLSYLLSFSTKRFSHQTTFLLPILSFVGGGITFLFALSFLITAYVQPDTRVQAAEFLAQHSSQDKIILSEVYDLGIVPFNTLGKIDLYNMYDIDPGNEISSKDDLQQIINDYDYFISPSQRLLKTRLLDSNNFPHGNEFYSHILQSKNGFTQIYKTPCDIFCKITYWSDPVFSFEQTANIFDRPTVYIFKNNEK